MHGEWRAFAWWFNVSFGVVEKNVFSVGDLLDSIEKVVVEQHFGENCSIVLQVVN